MTELELAIGFGILLVVGVGIYARLIEPAWLAVERVEIVVGRLPAEMDGLVIVQLSDLHIARNHEARVVRPAIAAADAACPDLVVLTGDIVDDISAADRALDTLSRLRSRPAVAILGNHEYKDRRKKLPGFIAGLESSGIRVLRNESTKVPLRSGEIWVVGLDDPSTECDDLPKALAEVPDDGLPRLLLTHAPDEVIELRPGEVDLALAGHTHGGQIYVPFLTNALLGRSYSRFSHGLYRYRGTPLYVSRGLGSLGVRARFLRRPEVTVITLRSPGCARGVSSERPANN